MSFRAVVRAVPRRCTSARRLTRRAGLHQTAARRAITNLEMPAMSPTMTEGGISSWKKKEGDSFTSGEVLLEIETDKATIDVEAQEDGVLGKILAPDGTKNVAVGKVIALLAEEGDDISNLEAPREEHKPPPEPEASAATPSPPPPEPAQEPNTPSHHPTHSKHLMPSVIRLLIEGGVADAEVIKGTGVRGMLTKGDVLAYLGKASSPLGTYKPPTKETAIAPARTVSPAEPLDGDAIRKLIVSGLVSNLRLAPQASSTPVTFDSVVADYLPPARKAPSSIPPVPPAPKDSTMTYFAGLF